MYGHFYGNVSADESARFQAPIDEYEIEALCFLLGEIYGYMEIWELLRSTK